jgi:hypothetical protein
VTLLPGYGQLSEQLAQLKKEGVGMAKVKMLMAAVAAAAVVGVPTAVMAASGGASSSLEAQVSVWTNTPVTTSSTQFRANVLGQGICALNQVTATLSVELHGAPAAFQIFVDNQIMQPGTVRFTPVGAHDSFSFTFVINISPFEGIDLHIFQVQWRSPTGAATTLERGTLNLQFQRGTVCETP